MRYINATLCTEAAFNSSSSWGTNGGKIRLLQVDANNHTHYILVTPEAIRNEIREAMCKFGAKTSRYRDHANGSPRVYFTEVPSIDKHVDAFIMGYTTLEKKEGVAAFKQTHKLPPEWYGSVKSLVNIGYAGSVAPCTVTDRIAGGPQVDLIDPATNAVVKSFNNKGAVMRRSLGLTALQYSINMDNEMAKNRLSIRNNTKVSKVAEESLKYFWRAVASLTHAGGNRARAFFPLAPKNMVVLASDTRPASPLLVQCFNAPDSLSKNFLESVLAVKLLPMEKTVGTLFIAGPVSKHKNVLKLERLLKKYKRPITLQLLDSPDECASLVCDESIAYIKDEKNV